MPDPRSRHFFGMALLGVILALGALAPVFIERVWSQSATYTATIQAPDATQLHYRFRNDDGGEQAAALLASSTSNPNNTDRAWAITINGSYAYIAGEAGGDSAYYEKRSLADLSLVTSTLSNAPTVAAIYGVASDANYLYAIGIQNNADWLIEKRNLSNLALVASSTSNPGSTDYAEAIAIDSTYMYVAGAQGGGVARIEKRYLSDLSLVAAKTSTAPGSADMLDMTIDSMYLYAAGYQTDNTWLVEKRNLSDLSLVLSTTSDPGGVDMATGIAINENYLYMSGFQDDSIWRIEKRNLSNLALSASTTSDPGDVSYANAISIDSSYMYVVGLQSSTNGYDWRLEKRKLSDLSLVYATSSNPSSTGDSASAIALDGTNMYVAGRQGAGTDLDWRIEKRTLGHDTSTATFSTTEDNPLLNLGLGTLTRLRMMVSNAGDVVATSSLYRLEYATSTSGPWTRVGSPASTSAHWIMGASAYVSDAQGTHNISGLTDPTSTVTAWSSGQIKSTSSQATLTSTLQSSQFTEYEYAVKGTGSSTLGIPYYFRLTNNGSSLTTYSTYASATLATAGITVSAITVNNGSPIILTPNTTTTVNVNWTVSGGQGCGNVFFSGGNVTSTLYRSGVSSTCSNNPTQSTLNCYYVATTTNNCTSATSTASANATTTFGVWYFAQATDASSTYASTTWGAFVGVRNGSGTVGTSTAPSGVVMNTVVSVSLASSSVDYGMVLPNANTGATNTILSIKNAGNSSTTLRLSGTAMNGPGSVKIPTSSQHYATNTFTYGVSDTALSDISTAVSGWLVQGPLSRSVVDELDIPEALQWTGGNAQMAHRGYLYAVGGADFNTDNTSTVWKATLSPTGSIASWATTTPYPVVLEANCGFTRNGYIYAMGGFQNNVATETTTARFAPLSSTGTVGTWATTSPMKAAVDVCRGAMTDSYVYVVGGIETAAADITSTVQFAPVNATGSLGAWATTTPYPFEVGCTATPVVWNGYLYVAGGIWTGWSCNSNLMNDVYRAPINTTGSLGAWVQMRSLPELMSLSQSFIDNGIYYIIADISSSTSFAAPIASDGSLGPWTHLPFLDASFDSAGGSHGIYNGRWYTAGGENMPYATTFRMDLPSRDLRWGLGVPAGTPQGTYTSTITLVPVWVP